MSPQKNLLEKKNVFGTPPTSLRREAGRSNFGVRAKLLKKRSKNHAISKLVVWRSKTPAIHIQTPP